MGAGERGLIEKDHKHNLKDIEALISMDASIAPSFRAIEIPIKVGFGTRPYCAILRRLMPWSNRVSPFLGRPHRPHRRQLRVRHGKDFASYLEKRHDNVLQPIDDLFRTVP